MRKVLLIVFIIVTTSFALFSQTVLLSGKVVDAENNEGLFGVNITINHAEELLANKQQLGLQQILTAIIKLHYIRRLYC